MTAARWGRLVATLAEHGHTVTVDEQPYTEWVSGRAKHGVSRSVTIALGGGTTIDIRDTWWPRNPDT